MKALAPRPANSLASAALAIITQTGLAAFFAAAMILITASFTDASADDLAPSATVRSPRPMKNPWIPSTAAMASI